MKIFLAEFIATFALVFCGTGAIIINEECGQIITHVGVAITFGLVVTAMIYTFGKTSGAHMNPAVTVALVFARQFPAAQILPYVFAQITGALTASLLLNMLFPANDYLGSTMPSGSAMQSLILEFILTFLLMLVILSFIKAEISTQNLAGLVIGLVVLLEALFAGPICGASMNPARSLAPALVSGHFTHLWIYMVAPFSGALFAVFVWRLINKIV